MKLREIQARILRSELDPANGRLACMSEAELDAEIVRALNEAVIGYPTYDALIADMAAMPEPDMREGAERARAFLNDYLARRARAQETAR